MISMHTDSAAPVYYFKGLFKNHGMHWHADLQVVLVLEGELHLKIGYESIDLKPRDIMLINSNEIHSMEGNEGQCNVLFLFINADYGKHLFQGFYDAIAVCPFRKAYLQTNNKRRQLYLVIEKVLERLRSKTDDQETDFKNRLAESVKELLLILIDCHKPVHINARRCVTDVPEEKVNMINRLLKLLRESTEQKVNLQDFADKEFVSMYHLSRCIKDVTGCSFRGWVSYYRLERAEKLLLTRDLTLAEISDQCGFSDTRYFIRQFKDWHKISPEVFRRNYQLTDKHHYETVDYNEMRALSRIKELTEENWNGHDENSYSSFYRAYSYAVSDVSVIELNLKDYAKIDFIQPWKKKVYCDTQNNSNDDGKGYNAEIIESLRFEKVEFLPAEILKSGRNRIADQVIGSIDDLLNAQLYISDLVTPLGFKSSYFQLYQLLNHLGKALIKKGPDFLVTSDNVQFQILLSNLNGDLQGVGSKEFAVILSNLNAPCIQVCYGWSHEQCDCVKYIKNPKVLQYISEDEKSMVEHLSAPEIYLDYLDASVNYTINEKLSRGSVKLIIIKPALP